MNNFLQTVVDHAKCIHGGAHATPRCVTCGAITNSHKLLEKRLLPDGSSYDQPFVALQQVQCPNCGSMVTVPHTAMQCHKCWTKALAERASGSGEAPAAKSSTLGQEAGGLVESDNLNPVATKPVERPKELEEL